MAKYTLLFQIQRHALNFGVYSYCMLSPIPQESNRAESAAQIAALQAQVKAANEQVLTAESEKEEVLFPLARGSSYVCVRYA